MAMNLRSNWLQHMPDEFSIERVTNQEVNIIAKNIGSEIETIATHMDITDNIRAYMDQLKARHPYNLHGLVADVLYDWRAHRGANATLYNLLNGMRECNEHDLRIDPYGVYLAICNHRAGNAPPQAHGAAPQDPVENGPPGGPLVD